MARELVRAGASRSAPSCGSAARCRPGDNARFAAEILARRGIARATVVTCEWHAPRAASLFRMHGVSVDVVPVAVARAPLRRRFWRWGRERVLSWMQVRGARAPA